MIYWSPNGVRRARVKPARNYFFLVAAGFIQRLFKLLSLYREARKCNPYLGTWITWSYWCNRLYS